MGSRGKARKKAEPKGPTHYVCADCGADGSLVDGSGSPMPMRTGIEEMKRLGARIVFSPGAWGPDRVRPSLSAPLLETTCQAPWFMRRDCEEVPCTR